MISIEEDLLDSETSQRVTEDSEYELSDFESEDADVDSHVSPKSPDNITDLPKPSLIVYWTSLLILLKRCLISTCNLPASITKTVFNGSQLIVKLKCQRNHTSRRSQPNCNSYSEGNLIAVAAVLFSANTSQRIANFFDIAGIQWISKICL